MRQLLLKYRFMTALFCLITMLSAFLATGEGSQKLVECSEQAEVECEELIHIRRQPISHEKRELAYSVYPVDDPEIRTSFINLAHLFGRNTNHERQHLNGCGSYLIV